jgi:hypothetical protein
MDTKAFMLLFLAQISAFGGEYWVGLSEDVKKKKWTLNLVDDGTYLLVNIVGKGDHNMIKMGEKYGFARGNPIIADREGKILMCTGFHCKFSNDNRQVPLAENIKKVCDGTSQVKIYGSLKYSGSLIGAVIFKANDGDVCFRAFSKNSGDPASMYVKEGAFFFTELLDQKTLDALYGAGVCGIWAEMMSKKDQVHGYSINEGGIVITAISYEIGSDTNRPTVLSGDNMLEILKPFPGLVTKAVVSFEITPEIFGNLDASRDLMTIPLLEHFIPGCGSRHLSMIGMYIEGIIFHVITEKGSSIIKYKFPLYMLVTLIVRDMYKRGKNGTLEADIVRVDITNFVDNWVVDKAKRANFRTLILMILKELESLKDDNQVAPWIRAKDIVYDQLFDQVSGFILPEPTVVKEYQVFSDKGRAVTSPVELFGKLLPTFLTSENRKTIMVSYMSFTGSLGSFELGDTDLAKTLHSEMGKYFEEWRSSQKASQGKKKS